MKKSIQSILYERITSPLSGALFFSWFAWNWKIPYILLFNKSDLTIKERLIFIQDHINICDGLLYPIISAIAIIAVYPLLTTGALFIWMKYKKWQRDIKNKIEKNELLTKEESNQIRLEILNQEENINRLLKSKDSEIELLRLQIEGINATLKIKNELIDKFKKTDNTKSEGILNLQRQYKKEYEALKKKQTFNSFGLLSDYIAQKEYLPSKLESNIINYYESHNIIEESNKVQGVYKFTPKGKYILKYYLDETMK